MLLRQGTPFQLSPGLSVPSPATLQVTVSPALSQPCLAANPSHPDPDLKIDFLAWPQTCCVTTNVSGSRAGGCHCLSPCLSHSLAALVGWALACSPSWRSPMGIPHCSWPLAVTVGAQSFPKYHTDENLILLKFLSSSVNL